MIQSISSLPPFHLHASSMQLIPPSRACFPSPPPHIHTQAYDRLAALVETGVVVTHQSIDLLAVSFRLCSLAFFAHSFGDNLEWKRATSKFFDVSTHNIMAQKSRNAIWNRVES